MFGKFAGLKSGGAHSNCWWLRNVMEYLDVHVIYVYIHIYICIYIYVYIYIHIHNIHIHIHNIHIHNIHTYIHIYTHVHIISYSHQIGGFNVSHSPSIDRSLLGRPKARTHAQQVY